MDNIYIIIPARKNSKRLPRKNISLLNHIPLIEHTFLFCKKLSLTNVIVSSDDDDIKKISKKYKFLFHKRRSELSLDTTPTLDVIKDVCNKFNITNSPILLLQPTSPFRSLDTFNCILKLFNKYNDTVITVEKILNSRIGSFVNDKYLPKNYNYGDRSQDIDSLYKENGNMYMFNSSTILNNKFFEENVYGSLIDSPEVIDIDYKEELLFADTIIKTFPKEFPEIIVINEKITIGKNQKCFIIAEACDNHIGNMDYAYKMVDIAVLAGADAVKFQHHLPDEEMLKDVPMSSNFKIPLYELLQRYSLTLDQHKLLKSYCDEKGIMYMCTPFSKKAADEINELVKLFKIGSGELTDHPTLIEIAKKGKPMIISTGMANIDEIEETLNILKPINNKIIIMNCTSEYPPNYKDINVKLIPKLEERFGIIVGHSDHTPDNYTCFAAVSCGAKIIEKHFILNKLIPGPDQNVSIDPIELNDLVSGIRKIEDSLGSEKTIHNLEKPIKSWARRSIVTIKDIKKGEIFTLENLWCKRPGTGIPSKFLFNILGKKAVENIEKDTLLDNKYI